MTTKHSAYHHRIYRDVNSALAGAVLIAFTSLLLLLA